MRILTFVLFLLLFVGCKKEDITFNTDLALDSRSFTLNAAADTAKIVVYSDGKWTLDAIDTAFWISIQKASGSGKDYAVVSVTDNSGNFPRRGRLVVRAGAKTDTIKLGQKGIVPKIAIQATNVQSLAAGGVIQTPIDTNLPLHMMSVNYKYDANGQDWISNLQIADNNLLFSVDANSNASARSATLYLSFLDAIGTTTKDSIKVNQLKQ